MNIRTSTLRPFMLLAGFLVIMASFLTALNSSQAQLACCTVTVNNNTSCTIGACVATPAVPPRCFFIAPMTSASASFAGCPNVTVQVRDACGNPITFPVVVGTCFRTTVRDAITGGICCVDICYLGGCTWDINPALPCPVC